MNQTTPTEVPHHMTEESKALRRRIAESFDRAAQTFEESLENARKMHEELKKHPNYTPAPNKNLCWLVSESQKIGLPERHCQNGRSDICLAANLSEPTIVCPHDSCDIDDKVRWENWANYDATK